MKSKGITALVVALILSFAASSAWAGSIAKGSSPFTKPDRHILEMVEEG